MCICVVAADVALVPVRGGRVGVAMSFSLLLFSLWSPLLLLNMLNVFFLLVLF